MRFISEDTNKGDVKDPLSLNLYTYCQGNPIKYVDPSGHDAIIITAKDGANHFGHTSAIFQDDDGNWYYYFWGDTKVTLNLVPDEAMKSLDAFNKWISDGAKTGIDFRGSQYYNKKYTHSTYIIGDFSASIDSIESQVKDYMDKYGVFNEDNGYYGAIFNNCLRQTNKAFSLGSYGHLNYFDVVTPNGAALRYRLFFLNSAFTREEYLKTMIQYYKALKRGLTIFI